ncbi:MAG: hypothetical protein INR73_23510 [Williamsia sp.]|nr:hypothetical protein [Williamsia sp.]
MKKLTTVLLLTITTLSLFAQSDKYKAAMQKNISQLDSAITKNTLGELSNNFERIGEVEKTQWLPYYYAAYCTVMNAYMQQDKSKVDPMADKADALVSKAAGLYGKESSEIYVIRSMIASSRMMVDPQSRWQQYGQASTENINKAKSLDPGNPRPVYLEGQAKFYTPEAFGGGKAPAKELFTKALQLFDTFKPQSELDPTWGKMSAQYFLAQCN